jgi:hypothetical protein
MAKRLSTSYLYRNPRSAQLFFRIRIPYFLQGVVSRKELRCSLQTADCLEAKYRAIFVARALKGLFAALSRNWWWIMKEMTREEIDYVVCKYMVDLLKYFEDYRALHDGPRSQDEYDWNLMLLDKHLGEAQKELILSDHDASGDGFDDSLLNWGFEDVDRDSYTYKKLRREFLKILAAEAADIAGHIGDLRGSLLLIDCGAQAVERSLQALPVMAAPKGCILALYNVRQDSAHAQWAADRGICDVFLRSESVDRILDGVSRCLG